MLEQAYLLLTLNKYISRNPALKNLNAWRVKEKIKSKDVNYIFISISNIACQLD